MTPRGLAAYVRRPLIRRSGKLFEERFENVSGTDETWDGTVTSGGGTVNTNAASSGFGSPPWWKTECMDCEVVAAGENAFLHETLGTPPNIAYIAFDARIDAHSFISDGQAIVLLDAFDDPAAADGDRILRVLFQRVTSSAFRFILQDWRDDIENSSVTNPSLWELDRPFGFQLKWDKTNAKVQLRCDGQIILDDTTITSARGALEYFRLGLQAAPVAARVQFDNCVIRTDTWPLAEQTKESSTLVLLWRETHEVTGYDEVWTDGEVDIGSGNSIDEDALTSTTTNPPAAVGAQAAKFIIAGTASGAIVRTQMPSDVTTKFFVTAYFYVASESLANDTHANIIFLKQVHPGTDIISFQLERDAVRGLHLRMLIAPDGKIIIVTDTLSTGIWHLAEIKVDLVNDFYAVWIDGILQATGAWLSTFRQAVRWFMEGQSGGANGLNITYWIDNYLVASEGWPDLAGVHQLFGVARALRPLMHHAAEPRASFTF